MRRFLLFFAILSQAAVASPAVNVLVNTAVNNLGTAYNTTFPQLTASFKLPVTHFGITNETSTRICCNVTTNSATVAPSTDDFCCPANSAKLYDLEWTTALNFYCRSAGGSTISTNNFDIEGW